MSNDGSYTLLPSRLRSPSCRIPGIRSLSRLMDRRNVDLPHPEGPMRAVTERGGTDSEIVWSACFFPYQKEKSRASIDPTVSCGESIRGAERVAVIRTVR